MVHRTQLIQDIMRQALKTGAVVICAPHGFGKTALLIQYVDEVVSDPGRGSARLIDAYGMRADELVAQLRVLDEELSSAPRPGIAVDNLPAFESEDVELVAGCIREMRDAGAELVLACTPVAHGFLARLGDSSKVSAEQLRVRPREYAEWVRVFSISPALDVYALTQGIPALVAALQGISAAPDTAAPLEAYVADIYRAALAELYEMDGARFKLAATLMLMGDGTLADLERAGISVDLTVLRRLIHDYPLFGYDASVRSFSCLGTEAGARVEVTRYIAAKMPALVRRVVRIQLTRGAVDRAVFLLGTCCDPDDTYHAIRRFPLQFVSKGYAALVADAAVRHEERSPHEAVDWNVVLAGYAAAFTVGDIRRARALRNELVAGASEATSAISWKNWEGARGWAGVWHTARDVALPAHPSTSGRHGAKHGESAALELHVRCSAGLIGRGVSLWFCQDARPRPLGMLAPAPRAGPPRSPASRGVSPPGTAPRPA